MTKISIKPVSILLDSLEINIDYRLNETAIIFYNFRDQDGNPFRSGNYQLTEEELSNWGTDDTYIENIILNKLGLERL